MHKKLKRFLFVLPAVVLFSFCLNASAAGGNTTLYNGNGTNVSGQTGSVFNPNHGLVIANPLASIIGNPNSPAPLVLESCRNYSGFINKIVKCITNFTSRAEVYQKLNALNGKFAGAANAVLIIYIMLFGLRLSMNVVDNVRGELVIAIMTCFFITYCNNAYRIDSFMRFFVGFQNEFANVAFVALGDTAHNGANSEKADCIISSQDPSGTRVLNLWERMDCVLATILGAQPLIELKGQYFDPNGQGNAADPASVTQLTNSNSNIVHQMLTDNGTLFPDLTKGPFCFFRYPSDLTSTNVSSIITNTSAVTSDACLTSLDLNDLDSIARPVKSDRYESYITFSFIVILVGALSQDPSIGLTIFLTGFFVAILVLAAFGQAVFVYITSLFAIMALGLFAPLILPCVLFKPTQGIFNQWVQMLFAYSLQPGILICYLSFMIFVLQFVLEYKHIGSRDPNVQCTSEDVEDETAANGAEL